MRFLKKLILAASLSIFSVVMGCQAINETPRIESPEDNTRIESPRDAAMSKLVKERLLADKAVDLTRINVRATDGAVELTGVVRSLDAKEHAVKLAWQVTGVKSVLNHLQVVE
jgi:hyperosmotically inducible periplasmic protein